MSRPVAFASSTIFDFRDLRSALKFWLEELGYEVLMSEHNDFEKNLTHDSYTACLESIDAADYFVLLIGGRRGGWFDEKQRISITRAEYQRAYARFKATGKPTIITFVRRAVLDVREDRKAVATAVAAKRRRWWGRSKAQKEVESAPSKIVDDPEAIFAFIDEVRRNEEMKQAVAGGGDRPPGNWIHAFEQFRDIVDVLRREFRLWRPLRHAALGANLKHELLGNLAALLGGKDEADGTLMPLYMYAEAAKVSFRGPADTDSTYKVKYLKTLAWFVLFSKVGARLHVHALDEAIRSTEFMEWDAKAHGYRVGLVQGQLLALRTVVEGILDWETRLASGTWKELRDVLLAALHTRDGQQEMSVSNLLLGPAFGLANLHINAVALLCKLCIALDGDAGPLESMQLKPSTPFRDQVEGLAAALVTPEDAARFVAERGRGRV